MSERKVPPGWLQADILIAQHNACVYCGHDFGDPVYTRSGSIHSWRELEWEHFVPYSYLLSNPDDNWLAACDVCNGFKSDMIFSSVQSVRDHVRDRYVSKRYTPLPIFSDYEEEWNGWTKAVNHDVSVQLNASANLESTVKSNYCKECGSVLENKKTWDIYPFCNMTCAAKHFKGHET